MLKILIAENVSCKSDNDNFDHSNLRTLKNTALFRTLNNYGYCYFLSFIFFKISNKFLQFERMSNKYYAIHFMEVDEFFSN